MSGLAICVTATGVFVVEPRVMPTRSKMPVNWALLQGYALCSPQSGLSVCAGTGSPLFRGLTKACISTVADENA